MLNKASRRRSVVGRTAWVFGPASGRERSLPPTTRIILASAATGAARWNGRGGGVFSCLAPALMRHPEERGSGALRKMTGFCARSLPFEWRALRRLPRSPAAHQNQPQRFKNLAHLAVLSFANPECKPDIGPLLTVESRLDGSVAYAVDGDATAQPVERLLLHAPECPHAVATQPAGCRQFQYPRKPAIIGEQQQPFGIDVEPADADQPRQTLRQRPENRIASLRIGMSRHQPARLVIEEKPGAFARPQRRPIDRNLIGRRDVECGRRNNGSVDRHAPCRNPGFSLASGGKPCARDHLGDAVAGCLRRGLV